VLRTDRDPYPSLGIIDAQSVKSTEVAGGRGFDGGKKIKGIKRHIIVDTLGLILTAGVHTAGIPDYQGAFLVLCPMFPSACSRLVKILADEGMISLASIRRWYERQVSESGFSVCR
jgi:hypothetical protein